LILAGRKTQTRRLATSPLSGYTSGDTLWVQEAFAPVGKPEAVGKRPKTATPALADSAYMRDGWRQYRSGAGEAGTPPDNSFGRLSWFQAVHMPLWASRLFLLVESVRIESLQFISKNDAISEGYATGRRFWDSPIDHYRKHWDAIRGTAGERWADNPAVVVLSFVRCAAPSQTSFAAPHHEG
jgi:hypothetical protein